MLARIDDTFCISNNRYNRVNCKLKQHSCANYQETENHPCLKTRLI